MTVIKQLNPPSLYDIIKSFKNDLLKSLNCIKIGRIESFDQTKKTATIQILFKRVLPDKVISYPLLVDCPVFTLQGGGGAIQMPIQAGDPCIVLFADRNIDNWYSNGSEAAPADLRCHHLNDGLAIVGINAINSTLPNYDTNVNLIVPENKKFKVSGTNATAEILGTAALALFSEIQTLRNEMNTFITTIYNLHTHTSVTSLGTPTVPLLTGASPTAPVGTTKLKGS